MKVLLANLQRDYGGAEIHVRMLAQGLHARGHAVTLLCHPDGKLRSNATLDGVATETLLVHNQLDPLAVGRFVTCLRRHRPDILHLHTPKEYLGGTLAAHLTSTPVALTRHMLLPLKPLMRKIYASADAVLCLSRGLQSLLVSQGLPLERLPLVYGAIDTAPFMATSTLSVDSSNSFIPSEPSDDLAILRAEWGASPHQILVGCVGRLVGGKGQGVLLEAFAHLLATSPGVAAPVYLVLVGDGPQRVELEMLASRLNLEKRVCFAGFRSDIPRVLAALDIVVMPSTAAELFPLSVLEAMATGRPVVASAVGGVPEILKEPSLGRLVPPGNPEALAGELARLVGDASLRRQVGISAAAYARKQFALPRFLDEVEAVYRQITSRPARFSTQNTRQRN